MKRKLLPFLVLCLLTFFGQVKATNFVVINLNDSGSGSLRAAVVSANLDGSAHNGSPHIISFDILGGGTIFLASALPDLSNYITIKGQTERITVSGGTDIRCFHVATNMVVEIHNLNITNGNLSNDFGGGILNDGYLILYYCTVSNNSVHSGTNQGGGIYNSSGSTLGITHSTISGNSAGNYGGGICNYGELDIINSTIAGNTASNGAGITSYDDITCVNVTIVDNNGGGVYYGGSSNNVVFANTIITGNMTETDLSASTSIQIIGGYSIFGTISTITFSDSRYTAGVTRTTVFGSNVLTNNGGVTQTIALIAGSPAIDAGRQFSGDTTIDQIDQPIRGEIDIGAFEFQPLATSTLASLSQDLVKVYSNPGNGLFEIEIGSSIVGTYDWKIMDAKGRLVLSSGSFSKGNDAQMQSVNLTNQTQGTYLLVITTEQGIINKSLIKL